MANYTCTIRSNYFHVNDEVAFERFMMRVYCAEDNLILWKEKDEDGSTVYAFGCYGVICGLRNAKEDIDETSDETAYDEFISGLQYHIMKDDAVIILESGNEKKHCVVGMAMVITKDQCENLVISSLATEKAAEMLGNKDYQAKY